MFPRIASRSLTAAALVGFLAGGLLEDSLAHAQGGPGTPPKGAVGAPDGQPVPKAGPPAGEPAGDGQPDPSADNPADNPAGQETGPVEKSPENDSGDAADKDGEKGEKTGDKTGEGEGGKDEKKDTDARYGFGWAGLPLLNFNTDTGVGYGARLVLFDYGKNQKPYKYRLLMQFYQSTGGLMFHRVSVDAPRLKGTKWRVDGNIRLDGDHLAPYYGLGGQSEYNAAYETCADRAALELNPDVCPGNPDFRGLRYYRYSLLLPAMDVNVRRDLRKPWQLMGGYSLQFAQIETQYPDELGQTTPSRLVEDLNNGEPLVGLENLDPNGNADLTRNGILQAGIVYDTRDNEPAPTGGAWHEFSLRAGSPVFGGNFWYWGAHLRLRAYAALDAARRLSVAGRLLFDVMGGDVPVYRLSRTGGLISKEVVGSGESVRGLLRARYVGKIKAIANAEIRWRFITVRPKGQRFDLTLVGGIDAGRAFRDFADLDTKPLDGALSTAGGLRIGWNENFVVRVDYGYSITDETTGFYIEFNHLY